MKTGRRRCYSLTICKTAVMSNNNEKLLVPPTPNSSKRKSQNSDGGIGSDSLTDNNNSGTSDADPELEESSAETSIGSSGIRSSTPSDYGN